MAPKIPAFGVRSLDCDVDGPPLMARRVYLLPTFTSMVWGNCGSAFSKSDLSCASSAAFFTDPAPARVLNALTAGAVAIPPPPRSDLDFLFGYAPPIAPVGNSILGPTADLLRLNVGVAPTAPASQSRLGTLGGDLAGFPNGRRPSDDVTDVMLRVLAGVYAPGFNTVPNNRLGDGVNVNDVPFRSTFPYLGNAPSGRDRRHLDPTEPGCTGGAGTACPF